MRKKILLVSNQPDFSGRLAARFRDSGFEVETAQWKAWDNPLSTKAASAVLFDCRSRDRIEEKLDTIRVFSVRNALIVLSDDTIRNRKNLDDPDSALVHWEEDVSVILAYVAGMLRREEPEVCLVVEDEPDMAEAISRLLAEHGYHVVVAGDLQSARQAIEERDYAILILDRNLPAAPGERIRADGLDLLRELRDKGFKVPALFVSALADTEERIRGRRAGANDYIVKPFDDLELLVRIELLLNPRKEQEILIFGSLEVHARDRVVRWRGERIMLTDREFSLFHYLCVRRGVVVPVAMLRADVWDTLQENSSAKAMVLSSVRFLRKKLREANVPEIILTEKGDGYVFDASALLNLEGEAR